MDGDRESQSTPLRTPPAGRGGGAGDELLSTPDNQTRRFDRGYSASRRGPESSPGALWALQQQQNVIVDNSQGLDSLTFTPRQQRSWTDQNNIFSTPIPDERRGNGSLPDGTASQHMHAGGSTATAEAYIWGTGIVVGEFRRAFRHFLETFRMPEQETGAHRGAVSIPHYIEELRRLRLRGGNTLEVDFTLLQRAAPELYTQAVYHPTECLQIMSAVAEDVYRQLFFSSNLIRGTDGDAAAGSTSADTGGEHTVLYVTACRLPSSISLKALSPEHVEKLICIRGMVVRTSKIIPEVRIGVFECFFCKRKERSIVGGDGGGGGGGGNGSGGRLFEPTRCYQCGKIYSFRLLHHLSYFEDKQIVKVQESPEHLADGETPVTVSVVVYSDMVDCCMPGDRVMVTGIFRVQPIRLNSNTRIVKSVFSTHVDAVHIEISKSSAGVAERKTDGRKDENTRNASDSDNEDQRTEQRGGATETNQDGPATPEVALDLTDKARLDVFYRIARRPDIYDVLLRSFARTIWGHEDVKKGILCQLFGGSRKEFRNGRFRAEINIILCGDPGVAKSQLLTQVHEISTRGVYTSGKGSSSVGLTAYVAHDHDTGELVLEPGALVLSDRGLCCIDEFDKMNDATRSVLHEVMEQQTLSVAKAGIIAQLNARTSILAAANPKESQWNPNLNVVENLQIEPTLLSRFDLIFLLLDRHDTEQDRRLASHVLSLFMDKNAASLLQRQQSRQTQQQQAGARRRRGGDPVEEADSLDDEDEMELAGSTSRGRKRRRENRTNREEDSAETSCVLLSHNGEVFLETASRERDGVDGADVYMPQRILSQYIALARDTVQPQLTDAAHKQLAASYVELRRARGSTRTVAATLRQLESMIRLAEATCKMRLGTHVSESDVMEAKRLISAALKESATDPRTGLISLDMFSGPDMSRNTMESNMLHLERVIQERFIAKGITSVGVNDLRLALNESVGGTVRPLAPTQFLELLNLMAGGDSVRSFTSNKVILAGADNA